MPPYTPPVERDLATNRAAPHAPTGRVCVRRGCGAPVKKATAKYCSVRCCSIDPERRQRIRVSSQRANRRVLPMSRQLTLAISAAQNPEAAIASLCEGREDVPRGMSLLSG